MRRLDRIAHCLGFALGMAACSATVAADGPKNSSCLVDSIDSQLASGSSMAEGLAALPLKLLRSGEEPSANLHPVCAGDRLASLGLSLIPGQTVSLTLITLAGVSVPLQVTELAGASEDAQTGTWDVSLRPLEAGANPPSAQLIKLVVTAGESNRRGQQRSFRLFGSGNSRADQPELLLELHLESLDSEQMFRDNFTVDPSVGQFSQRTRRPRTTGDQAVQGAGSATL